MSQTCKRCSKIVERACQSESEWHDCPNLNEQQRDPARIYRGLVPFEMEWDVFVEEFDDVRKLNWRLDLANHSPTGLSWGYGGSGPHQCALAILADAVGDELAKLHYHEFCMAKIARFDKNKPWSMNLGEVQAWVTLASIRAAHREDDDG